MKYLHPLLVVLIAGVLAPSCISKNKHESALNELQHTQDALDSRESALNEALEYIEELKGERYDADERLAMCERSIRNSIRESQEVGRLLNGCRSNLLETTAELKASKNRAKSAQSQSTEERQQMEREREKLVEQLNALQAENRERERLYQEMTERFDKLISAGQLDVTMIDGRLVINMPQDILFKSGSSDVERNGRNALLEVGSVLAELSDRQFQVEGHTDNVPISTRRFPSNWELSSARALSVVHILKEGGVPSKNLSAAGYGEYHPVASNDTKESRKLNRRIEIVVLPNLQALDSTQ